MPEDFTNIFQQIRGAIVRYAPELSTKTDTPKAYQLYSIKDIELAGRKFSEIYFAGAVIQKNFVGFYFFPIYTHPEKFTSLPAALKKTLKGKFCFNFKKIDKELLAQVDDLLKQGFSLYQNLKLI